MVAQTDRGIKGLDYCIFNGVKETQGHQISLETIVKIIGSGGLKDATDAVRRAPDDRRAKERKERMHAVCYGGRYASGNRKGTVDAWQPSGLVYVDIDIGDKGNAPPDAGETALEVFRQHPNVVLMYPSVSGTGLHVVYRVDPAPSHPDYCHAYAACAADAKGLIAAPYFVDQQASDPGRIAFLAHYDGIRDVFNPDADPLAWDKPSDHPAAPKIPLTAGVGDDGPTAERAMAAAHAAAALEHPVWTDVVDDRTEWRDVGMALHQAETAGKLARGAGRGIWDAWSQKSDVFDGKVQAKTWESFKDAPDRALITVATIYGKLPPDVRRELAKEYGPRRRGADADGVTEGDGLDPYYFYAGNVEHRAQRFLAQAPDQLLLVQNHPEKGDDPTAKTPSTATRIYTMLDGGGGVWGQDSDKLWRIYSASLTAHQVEITHADASEKRKVGAYAMVSKALKESGLAETLRRGAAGYELLQAAAAGGDERAKTALGQLQVCDYDDLDKDGRYLGCANGVVDLRTGGLLPKGEAAGCFVTRTTGVKFNSAAKHDAVDRLLSHLDTADAAYLWAALGRAVWGQPDKSFIILLGPSNGGKTTLQDGLKAALGRECGTLAADALRPSRSAQRTGPTPELAPLVECRIVNGAETEGWKIDPAQLKTRLGGGDTIPYRPLYQAQRDATLRATGVMSCNELPPLALWDEAVATRTRIVRYPPPAKIDKSIKAAFGHLGGRDVLAVEAMLARLIRHATENPPGTDILIPPGVQAELDRAISDETDGFPTWLKAAVVRDQGTTATGGKQGVQTTELWNRWAERHGVTDSTEKVIGGVGRRELSRLFRGIFKVDAPTQVRTQRGSGKGWYGFRLRDAAEVDALLDDADDAGGAPPEPEKIPSTPPAVGGALQTTDSKYGLNLGDCHQVGENLLETLQRVRRAYPNIPPQAMSITAYIDPESRFLRWSATGDFLALVRDIPTEGDGDGPTEGDGAHLTATYSLPAQHLRIAFPEFTGWDFPPNPCQ